MLPLFFGADAHVWPLWLKGVDPNRPAGQHAAGRELARGMTPVLAVRDLTVSFAARQVVAGIGFGISAGRTLGVVGESGCGKTLTALAVMGLVPAARPRRRVGDAGGAGNARPAAASLAQACAAPAWRWCSRSR